MTNTFTGHLENTDSSMKVKTQYYVKSCGMQLKQYLGGCIAGEAYIKRKN